MMTENSGYDTIHSARFPFTLTNNYSKRGYRCRFDNEGYRHDSAWLNMWVTSTLCRTIYTPNLPHHRNTGKIFWHLVQYRDMHHPPNSLEYRSYRGHTVVPVRTPARSSLGRAYIWAGDAYTVAGVRSNLRCHLQVVELLRVSITFNILTTLYSLYPSASTAKSDLWYRLVALLPWQLCFPPLRRGKWGGKTFSGQCLRPLMIGQSPGSPEYFPAAYIQIGGGECVSGIRLQKAFNMKSGKLQPKENAMESRDEETFPTLMQRYEIS